MRLEWRKKIISSSFQQKTRESQVYQSQAHRLWGHNALAQASQVLAFAHRQQQKCRCFSRFCF